MTITDFGVAVVDGDSHLSKWILEQRKLDVDGSAHEVAKRFIKPGDIVVDAGACLGDHTKVYLDAVGRSGRVFAFEPNLRAFECLVHNCPHASVFHLALGVRAGLGRITMGDENADPPHTNLGAARVVLNDYGPVYVMPLDALFLQHLNFFKLDVEGMEYDALVGAEHTIRRCRPVVMAEINPRLLMLRGSSPNAVIDLMADLGYRWELLDPRYGFDQEHTDVLFLPSGKPVAL